MRSNNSINTYNIEILVNDVASRSKTFYATQNVMTVDLVITNNKYERIGTYASYNKAIIK